MEELEMIELELKETDYKELKQFIIHHIPLPPYSLSSL